MLLLLYVIKKLSFKDEPIRKASVSDIEKRVTKKFSDAEHFRNRFNLRV